MKEKKLLRALGNVDNQYIKEAEPMKKTSKITNRQKWAGIGLNEQKDHAEGKLGFQSWGEPS